MTKLLFQDFNAVSAKAWKQKIQLDLKGEDYNDALIWNSIENIDIKPFYHSEDLESLNYSIDVPKSWNICETIYVKNSIDANKKALQALLDGAQSLTFIITDSAVSLQNLLKNINLSCTVIYIELTFLDANYILNNGTDKIINFSLDIIGNLVKSGNWFTTKNKDYLEFDTIIKNTKTFSIDVSHYQNSGASIIQQLAYAMAHANEYLNHIDNNKSIQSIFSDHSSSGLKIILKVSVGTNYFFEIAKLRAMRLLFKQLISEYNFKGEVLIKATPTKRNKTLYDYNTNMLRTTTECMASILGGANSITNLAYDTIYHKKNEFGSRIARNQLLILRHESNFEDVAHVPEGSYYIESLIHQFAEKSLKLFKLIEAKGGFTSLLFNGVIQRKIAESAQKEQSHFDDQKEVLVGTNKYINLNDKMKQELEIYPFVKTNVRKTLIKPIIEKRISETIEKERIKNEKN